MTIDHAVALSLFEDQLTKPGLTARLLSDDPDLLELASSRLDEAREVRDRAEQAGIRAIAWNDPSFPSLLVAISDCPPVIWYRGELPSFDSPMIAIVGSRAASSVAVDTAARLATDLAARGVTVVSGLARGVDSAAHRGALTNGRTIAVLGSGVDCIYPPEHKSLAAQIAEAGLVVSEYPPGTPPLPHHFPLRNRLISGLSLGVVVIEASEKSGSLITAACALDQGREVMAVPGNVLSGRNRGGHALLRDGAKIVETADDIVEGLGWDPRVDRRLNLEASSCPAPSSADPVLRAMVLGEPYDLDALASRSGLDVRRLLPRLIELELAGLVRRHGGGRFVRPS
ncbi:MAG TPA: DNA-processing protein DprA [Vicinamibacterales bacterium]|nr:DNA-processing protein DprA [Vicinamibacterales bacterium]